MLIMSQRTMSHILCVIITLWNCVNEYRICPIYAETRSRTLLPGGFYELPFMGKHYPRVQILTIVDLLEGKWFEFPEPANATFEKAAKSKTSKKQVTIID